MAKLLVTLILASIAGFSYALGNTFEATLAIAIAALINIELVLLVLLALLAFSFAKLVPRAKFQSKEEISRIFIFASREVASHLAKVFRLNR